MRMWQRHWGSMGPKQPQKPVPSFSEILIYLQIVLVSSWQCIGHYRTTVWKGFTVYSCYMSTWKELCEILNMEMPELEDAWETWPAFIWLPWNAMFSPVASSVFVSSRLLESQGRLEEGTQKKHVGRWALSWICRCSQGTNWMHMISHRHFTWLLCPTTIPN